MKRVPCDEGPSLPPCARDRNSRWSGTPLIALALTLASLSIP